MKSFSFLFFVLFTFSVEAESEYPYEPNVVCLNGKLVKEIKYGAPNYGETPDIDKKTTIYVLVLNSKITVGTNESLSEVNTDVFHDVKYLQLIIDSKGSKENLERLVGGFISVKGKLFQKISGHHYYSVLMSTELENISKI
ncbi:hypothetical protein C3B51_22735 [Pseudoalteromonas rubra]|uniref:DUF4431 domain-containing protein n=1 Tax=Pseudoalteromonas rubra TaxID=43658 RepID=A0A4Q7DY46_9GAMM|nr:hypothetical protein [Pseudoalteromonas rubra]RZM71263.1 hypothetical protein C3B51_22735 [Pseudoalteromonas rubra]